MTDRSPEKNLGRREFLVASGSGVAVGGAVLATRKSVAVDTVEPKAGKKTSGYKATKHVRTYYELARF